MLVVEVAVGAEGEDVSRGGGECDGGGPADDGAVEGGHAGVVGGRGPGECVDLFVVLDAEEVETLGLVFFC